MSEQGGQRDVSPNRAPKKHTTFNIWRIKKKHQHSADYAVFVPHPPPPAVSEEPETPAPSILEPPVGNHDASQETPEYTRHCRELQPNEISPEVQAPLPTETGILKKKDLMYEKCMKK